MRVYLPATLADLADLARSGELGPAPLAAYAVTDALRAAYGDSDDEELEYFATSLAAEESFRRLTASSPIPDPSGASAAPLRRVVVAADLPDTELTLNAAAALGAVRLSAPVPMTAIASFHVDESGAGLDPADPEAAADLDLLWYAVQELGDLVEPWIVSDLR